MMDMLPWGPMDAASASMVTSQPSGFSPIATAFNFISSIPSILTTLPRNLTSSEAPIVVAEPSP